MHRNYFSQDIDSPQRNSERLKRSLVALRLEVSPAVADHHSEIVRKEIERLTDALRKIARGYPCERAIDMQRIALEAVAE